tara:strand:- start:187 stop:1431 length:1245 start_codon:yes stop_codon:yes gene_type:complete
MGASNSSTMKNTSTTNITNDFMQSVSMDIENRNEAELSMTQELEVIAPGMVLSDNCSVDINQAQVGTLTSSLDAMSDLTTEQKAELSADISNAQSQALEQANEDLAVLPQSNESDIENEITTNVTNSLETSIDKTFANLNFASGDATQKARIEMPGLMCSGDASVSINQEQVLSIISENLAETITDVVQSGEAVTEVTNEQSQSVKQTNKGIGISASGSSGSSSSSIIISAVACAALLATGVAASAVGSSGSGKPSMPLPGKLKGGGMNMGALIGILIIGFALLVGLSYFVFTNTPKYPCPTEKECSKAWDEIKAAGMYPPGDLLRKYHNCRIGHRVNLEKPELFRPRCETYCAYVERESENPQYPDNPLESLFCAGADAGADPNEGAEEFTNSDPEEEMEEDEPEGFGNYHPY